MYILAYIQFNEIVEYQDLFINKDDLYLNKKNLIFIFKIFYICKMFIM